MPRFAAWAAYRDSDPQAHQTPNSGIAPNGLPYFTWDQGAVQLNRQGQSWAPTLGTPVTITYGYRLSGEPAANTGVTTFQQFNAIQIAVTEQLLQRWAEVANITFLRVNPTGYTNDATMLFGNFMNGPPQFSAFAYLPDPSGMASNLANGDVWVNGSRDYDANPAALPRGAQILLHEIGHTLGLLHPSDYGGGAQSGPTYESDADFWQDTRQFTVLSYFNETPTGASYGENWVTSPQMFDIAAAQRLYGANMTTRTGNTVYGFNSNTGIAAFSIANASQGAVFCIWDAGGIDTIDVSGYATNSEIDLREEAFSSAGSHSLGAMVGNISIARGAVIENAIGGSGNDTLIGNAAANELRGNGGADSLTGADGNDTIFADSLDTLVSGGNGIDWVYFTDNGAVNFNAGTNGVEVVFAGGGNDTINASTQTLVFTAFGGGGGDTITGGSNGDTLFGQDGNDTLTGGGGGDALWGEAGADQLSGGEGNDTLFVDALDTFILGGNGYDYIYFTGAGNFTIDVGIAGLEWVFSGGGADTINAASQTAAIVVYGGADGDAITGGAGADVLFGQDGADTIVGGAQNDTLWGEAGADSLSGGDGDDTLIADATDTLVSGEVGYDYVYVTGAGDFSINAGVNGVEWVFSSSGNDTINAATQSAAIIVYAGSGGDTVTGGAGADVIFGQDGNDILTGGAQNDTLWGEAGADQLSGGEGDDTLIVDVADTLVSGGNGYDFVYVTGAGNFSINAGANGIEWIDSGAGNDTLNGAAHTTAFTAYGGDGADTITGGSGNDVLFGEDGADVITGGGGGDVFIGGAGADTFVFAAGWGSDLLTDFQNGSDHLDMTALAGSGVTSIGDLTISAQGADALISWNGNSILIQNAAGQIDSSDFIFGP